MFKLRKFLWQTMSKLLIEYSSKTMLFKLLNYFKLNQNSNRQPGSKHNQVVDTDVYVPSLFSNNLEK